MCNIGVKMLLSVEYRGVIMKIKNKELWRTIKYTLFAISAGAIELITATVLELILNETALKDHTMYFIIEYKTPTFIANTVGLALSVLWNCTFNRKFTFKAANNVPLAIGLALLFYVPFYPFQIWYTAMIDSHLVEKIGEFGSFIIGLVTVMIINFVLEFLWQRFVVFRKSIDTNAAAQKEHAGEQAEAATAADDNEGNVATESEEEK